MGLGVEWNGLVVGGGQIGDVGKRENKIGVSRTRSVLGGSRTRSVLGGSGLGGDNLDGGADELPRRLWVCFSLVLGCDLAGAGMRSRRCYRRCDLAGAIWGWGRCWVR